MKKTITKTITETATFCDHCGKQVHYSEQLCVVCGKAACNACFADKLDTLKLDSFPKFWPPSLGVHFHAYACHGCANEITELFNEVKSKTAKANAQCLEWERWYRDSVLRLNKLQEQAEKKRETR